MSRRQGRFVAVNCGALPPNLVEGQLFGHVRGAFSGAVGDQLGFVREADGGTLLLDEIGDLPKEAQSTFLRVLQEGEVVPLGRARPVEVDVRVMAATQEPLDTLVGAGTFRADLRARVEGYLAHVPTLRERREDIGILIAALLDKLAPGRNFEIRPDAGRAICNYDWPLNVRELEQSLSRALALAGELPIAKTHLPPLVAAAVHRPEQRYWEDDQLLREQLVTKLREHGGNVAHVARALGRARMQIHRWMARLSIDPNDYRAAKS